VEVKIRKISNGGVKWGWGRRGGGGGAIILETRISMPPGVNIFNKIKKSSSKKKNQKEAPG